jgi:hypothetical protein
MLYDTMRVQLIEEETQKIHGSNALFCNNHVKNHDLVHKAANNTPKPSKEQPNVLGSKPNI